MEMNTSLLDVIQEMARTGKSTVHASQYHGLFRALSGTTKNTIDTICGLYQRKAQAARVKHPLAIKESPNRSEEKLWPREYTLSGGHKYSGFCKVVNGAVFEKSGYGLLEYASGGTYDGNWDHDKRNGKGVRVWPNGDKYDGKWEDDNMHGKGTFLWQDGRRYEGGWKRSRRSGEGVLKYWDGGKYEGSWKDDSRHGHGVNTWPNGRKYTGNWEKNKMSGYGVMEYPDGRKCGGQWSNDNWCGSSNGRVPGGGSKYNLGTRANK
jgi:hypothetical protein